MHHTDVNERRTRDAELSRPGRVLVKSVPPPSLEIYRVRKHQFRRPVQIAFREQFADVFGCFLAYPLIYFSSYRFGFFKIRRAELSFVAFLIRSEY